MLSLRNLINYTVLCGVLMWVTSLTALPFDPEDPGQTFPIETCGDGRGGIYIDMFANMYNCSAFWQCTEYEIGYTTANFRVCPYYTTDKGDLELLSWNFISCKCDYPCNTQCYNYANFSHTAHRFDCATKINQLPPKESIH